ncbi:MAG: response regulator, partial [Chthoniobacterales bacterium]
MSEIHPHSQSLAQVRHDMRTPLNHILGFSELLTEDADTIKPPELKSDLDKIQTAAKDLLTLIDTHLSEDGVKQWLASDAVVESAPPSPAVKKITPSNESGDTHDPVARVSGRILVVDDNASNCETLSRRLNKQGHETAVAHNGEAALGILRTEKFDLVLLDILMPGIDGYAVLQEMKSDHALRHIPVIMISALDEMDSVVHCIESGAEDYLSKPFNPTLLRARIGASLEKKALRDDEQRHLKVIEETQDRLKHELDEAARYVRSIIPEPITTPVHIDWRYIPSTELGGDAFGYHMIDDSHLAIYLLDVCGHGVGASLLSVTAMN